MLYGWTAQARGDQVGVGGGALFGLAVAVGAAASAGAEPFGVAGGPLVAGPEGEDVPAAADGFQGRGE